MKFNNTITITASILAILTYFGVTLNAQKINSALVSSTNSASSATDKGAFVVKIGEGGRVSAGMATHKGVSTSTASGRSASASGASPDSKSSTSRSE